MTDQIVTDMKFRVCNGHCYTGAGKRNIGKRIAVVVCSENGHCRIDKQMEKHLDEIRADLQAKKQRIQKTSLAEKTAHKIYMKMVKNSCRQIP